VKERRSWRRNAVIGGLAVMLAAGCAGPEQTAIDPKPTDTAMPTPTPEVKPNIPAITFPLTGLPAKEEIKDRPVMVMIENSPAARPQTGLHQADWVYEILAEGEVTRFAAFYQSERPAVIGPVRSIRPYYVRLGHGHGAIVVHAGWSQDAMNEMTRLKVDHLDQVYGDDKYYWRDNSRKAPHNLYTSIDKVMEGATAKKFASEWKGPRPAFAVQSAEAIEAMALPQGRSAQRVVIPYLSGYKVEYEWDATARTYLRTMAGKPHSDKDTGERLKATNILIVEAAHKVLDKEGRREVDVTGTGKGVLITGGQAADITWANKDGMIRAYQGEREIPLTPGKTWVQVVPTGTAVTIE
jgi:hypothetical protein